MEDRLEQLRRRFLQRCELNLPALQAGHSLLHDAGGNEQGDFLALVHSLAGAGGTFGFEKISNAAIELETVLRGEGGSNDVAAADALLCQLEAAVRAALKTSPNIDSP